MVFMRIGCYNNAKVKGLKFQRDCGDKSDNKQSAAANG